MPISKTRLFTLVLAAALSSLAVLPAAGSPPDILLIVADDLGYGDLSCHGSPHIRTPALDALRQRSAYAERFYVCPVCAPTRAGLLTGRYSVRCGVQGVASGWETMRAEEVTLAEELQRAGYRTGLFGKWHNGEQYPCIPNGQGFGEFLGYQVGHWNRYFDSPLRHNRGWKSTTGYLADVVTIAALDFLAEPHDAPKFAMLSLPTPHSPFQVPNAGYDRGLSLGLTPREASIVGMAENIDHNVARVDQYLAESPRGANTIVIFMSDNGPNGKRYTAGLRGTKGTLYEGGIRSPFFVSWPRGLKQTTAFPSVVAHIDVAPTLLELAGVTHHGPSHDGISWAAWILGGEPPQEPRNIYVPFGLAGDSSRWKAAVVGEQYKLVGSPAAWELYDLHADPAETQNLALAQSERVRDLGAEYARWWAVAAKDLPRERPAIPVGYTDWPETELPASHGTATPDLQLSSRHPNNAWWMNWLPESAVTWPIQVQQAGRYEVRIEAAIATPGLLEMVSDRQTFLLPAPQLVSQRDSVTDRIPRDEAAAQLWQETLLGTIELTTTTSTLTLRLPNEAAAVLTDLKQLKLTRVD